MRNIIFAMLLLTVFSMLASAKSVNDINITRVDSVFSVLEHMKKGKSIEDVRNEIGKEINTNVNIISNESIVKYLKACGLTANEYKLSAEDIGKLSAPVLAMMWDDSCYAVMNDTTGKYKILSSNGRGQYISPVDFEKLYSGIAIAIGEIPTDIQLAKNGADARMMRHTIDFGNVLDNASLSYTFTGVNKGDNDLVITSSRSTCDCVKIEISNKTVAKNADYSVKVAFDPAGRFGYQQEKIYLSCNDPITPILVLSLVANIRESKLDISDRVIDFGLVGRGTRLSKTITITDRDNNNFKVTNVAVKSKYLQVGYSKSDVADWVYTITVALKEDLPFGKLTDILQISTTHEIEKIVEIPINIDIVTGIEVEPIICDFGMISQNKPISLQLDLYRPGKSFTIQKISSSAPDEVFVTADGKDNRYSLTVKFTPNGKIGVHKGYLYIVVDVGEVAKLTIPYFAILE